MITHQFGAVFRCVYLYCLCFWAQAGSTVVDLMTHNSVWPVVSLSSGWWTPLQHYTHKGIDADTKSCWPWPKYKELQEHTCIIEHMCHCMLQTHTVMKLHCFKHVPAHMQVHTNSCFQHAERSGNHFLSAAQTHFIHLPFVPPDWQTTFTAHRPTHTHTHICVHRRQTVKISTHFCILRCPTCFMTWMEEHLAWYSPPCGGWWPMPA